MPEIDPEQLMVLRLLKAAFGDVEVLEVIDNTPATLPAAQGWLFDEEGDDDGPEPDGSSEVR